MIKLKSGRIRVQLVQMRLEVGNAESSKYIGLARCLFIHGWKRKDKG